MGVEKELGETGAEGGHRLGAEGEVGHKVSIHDIDVEPRKAEVGDVLDAGSESGVVAGKEGGGEERSVLHAGE
jgi:hypothetical protein